MITFDTFYTIQRVSGLSQDDKPMGMKPGSIFMELDTGKKFIFDGETWHEQPQGGGVPEFVESIDTFTHDADWTTDDLGTAENFYQRYCNGSDVNDRHLYVCYVSNNAATSRRADYLMAQRVGTASSLVFGTNLRDGNNWAGGVPATRSFYVAAGAKVTVVKIKPVM